MPQEIFKRIIVPLDGSSTAEVALPYAEELAARMGCDLILLLVKELNDFRSENILRCYLDEIVQKVRRAMQPFLKESEVKDITIEAKILMGNPAEEIIGFTENRAGSYVIMATHGQSGLNTRWALGSVVEKVVRAVNAPVGVIRAIQDKPAVHEAVRLKHILAPLDGSKESESSLLYIKEMANLLKAEVTLIQINKLDFDILYSPWNRRRYKAINRSIQKYLEETTKSLEKSGIDVHYIIRETKTDIADEINKYTQENQVDVVIMATHGYSGPRRWILGSVTNKVMMEGNTPIILVNSTIPRI